MSNAETRLIDTIFDDDGTPYAETWFSPTSNTTRAMCVAPPATTIPVVFVPGVMGSNLKAKEDIKDPIANKKIFNASDRVWIVDGLLTAANPFEIPPRSKDNWWRKDGRFRQSVMNHEAVEVDNSGEIGQGTQLDPTHRGRGMPPQVPTGATPISNLSVKEAKKRGWGSPGWEYYGSFLDWLEYHLNKGRLVENKPDDVFQRLAQLAGQAPDDDRAGHSASPLTEEQIRKTLDIHMPVYAVGYNWLQSTMQSGEELMNGVAGQAGDERVLGINEIIERENGKPGQVCNQVIVITHSMGGLVGRAAALKYDDDDRILGMIHGVQPIDGAAKFYKALAAGFGGIEGPALGATAKESTPEIAYNPGPLELAPNKRYNGGKAWLFVKDQKGNKLGLPQNGDPYEEIYMDTENVWRAVNPEWLDPAGSHTNPKAVYIDVVGEARAYHDELSGQLHPQTYAHWGDDPSRDSYGTVTWTTDIALPNSQTTPSDWTFKKAPLPDGIHRTIDRGDGMANLISIESPTQPGDGTVPAQASGAQIAKYPGCRIACALKGFDHQGDFDNDQVRDVVLDAIVRLVEPVDVNQ